MQNSRKVCGVGALLFFLYVGLLSWKSIAGFPVALATHRHWPWLGSKPFGEDGFYLLTVANYLATTHHLLYNYGRVATGIQPLITFVFAAIAFAVNAFHGDRWVLIRVLILFNSALFVLFAWQMAWIARQFAPAERRNLVFVFGFFSCPLRLHPVSAVQLRSGDRHLPITDLQCVSNYPARDPRGYCYVG